MSKLKGIYKDLSNNDYHSEKLHLSSSNLKLLLKDPMKFYDEKILGNRKNESKAVFDEGNYAHSLILEPHTIDDEYAFFSGFRKSGKDWQNFKAQHEGKILLSKPQKHRVEKWVASYESLPVATNLISGCDAEYSLFGKLMDVPVKVRADAINIEKGYIADVKTTSYDTDVDSFKYVVDSLRYDLSASLYCQMFEQHYEKPFDFYFIVLGKKDGQCQVYKASEQTLEKGRRDVFKALKFFKEFKKNNWQIEEKNDIIEEDTEYEIQEI